MFAAKAAYETYAQRKFPKASYSVTDTDIEEEEGATNGFKYHESEAMHAMSVAITAQVFHTLHHNVYYYGIFFN